MRFLKATSIVEDIDHQHVGNEELQSSRSTCMNNLSSKWTEAIATSNLLPGITVIAENLGSDFGSELPKTDLLTVFSIEPETHLILSIAGAIMKRRALIAVVISLKPVSPEQRNKITAGIVVMNRVSDTGIILPQEPDSMPKPIEIYSAQEIFGEREKTNQTISGLLENARTRSLKYLELN